LSFDFVQFFEKKSRLKNSCTTGLNITKSHKCTPTHQRLSYGNKNIVDGNKSIVEGHHGLGDFNVKNKQIIFLKCELVTHQIEFELWNFIEFVITKTFTQF